MATFSDRLRESLAYQRFSNRKIADEIGVSPTSIANILSGENKPNIETVTKLVEVLKINGHWLLTGEGEMWIAGSELKGALHAQVAYNIGGDNTQLHIAEPAAPYDPCASLRTEVAYLRQQVADKEEIIGLLKAAQPK